MPLGDTSVQKWEGMHPADFDGWSKTEKVLYACRLVVFDGWTRADAAKATGVTYESIRRRLNGRPGHPGILEELEAERDKIAEQADTEVAQVAEEEGWTDDTWKGLLSSARRIGTPWGFQKHYFGHVVCPDCLQQHAQPGFHREILKAWHHPDTRRFLTNIPPYHAKTTVFSVWDTIYDIVENPNTRQLLVSKTNPFAQSILFAIQQWLTDEGLYDTAAGNLIRDYGPFRPDETGSWSKNEIFVKRRNSAEKDPTVLALGVQQQVYGRRADKIRADDIATLENMGTPGRINKVMEWIDKELLSRIGKNGRAGFMGTRVAPGDIYGIMAKRVGYRTVSYPAVINYDTGDMLWGDHFGLADAKLRMSEMSDADWKMVYQQVDLAVEGLAFTAEAVDNALDTSRVTGHFDPSWTVVAGIDLAGSRKTSGYTVLTVKGFDRATQKRYNIDVVREKSMSPDRLRAAIFSLTEQYPIIEWRVEANAMQEQIVQMNSEISKPLASKGVRIVPHQTQGNKWDKDFGVESMVPLLVNGMVSIPWATDRDRHIWMTLKDEMLMFPLGGTSDHLMADWFAELAVRSWLQRETLPVFQGKPVPEWVAKRRRIYRRGDQQMERVPVRQQQRLSRQGGRISHVGYDKGLNPDEW